MVGYFIPIFSRSRGSVIFPVNDCCCSCFRADKVDLCIFGSWSSLKFRLLVLRDTDHFLVIDCCLYKIRKADSAKRGTWRKQLRKTAVFCYVFKHLFWTGAMTKLTFGWVFLFLRYGQPSWGSLYEEFVQLPTATWSTSSPSRSRTFFMFPGLWGRCGEWL